MSVTYLLPSNRPTLATLQLAALHKMCRRGDDVAVSTIDGMCNAIRNVFKQAKTEIVRFCADDDEYGVDGSFKAVEIMERDPSIDVLVTGGLKSARGWREAPVCVPAGENYGASPESVAWYGACGSGMFLRTAAIEKYGLLDYDGRLVDNYIVLKAITSGANVKFCRLDTFRHYMSLSDMTPAEYATFRGEKKALRESFGIWGVKRRKHEAPPKWDGVFA